jgi:hypothetical protein
VLGQKKQAKKPAMSDQNFINFAAQTDMVEANLGQLAQAATFVFKSLRDFPFVAFISALPRAGMFKMTPSLLATSLTGWRAL